jgi:IclR family transcriptional regulator, pca regulon regulatory protein
MSPRKGPPGAYPETWKIPDLADPSYSQSLERGLAILECFTADRPVQGIADIADDLGMSRSTTHRYVSTLVKLGYVKQGQRRKYRLSLGVTRLGMQALNGTGLRDHAREDMAGLSTRVSCDVSLAALDEHGAEIVYIERVRRLRRGQPDAGPQAGSRLPAHCTAMGKILLAHLADPELDEMLAEMTLESLGPNTITDAGTLRAELEQIRDEGLALEDQERAEELIGIATPVRDEIGDVVAALDLSVRAPGVSIEEFADALYPHLISTADRISSRLGYRRPDEGSSQI